MPAAPSTRFICTALLYGLICSQICLAVSGWEQILQSGLHRRQVNKESAKSGYNAEGVHECDKYTWIDPALDIWFEKILAFRSKMMADGGNSPGLEAVLQDLRETQWSNGVKPGKTEVILQKVNEGVNLTAVMVSKPNAAHKPPGMVHVLSEAVAMFEKDISDAITGPSGEIRVLFQFEDFPLLSRSHGPNGEMSPNWLLPCFSMCTASDTMDVPVPDFTFALYPEMKREDASWKTVRGLLLNTSDALPWDQRENVLFWRGAFKAGGWDNGPRATGAHLFENTAAHLESIRRGETENPSLNVARLGKTDWQIDIMDTGFTSSNTKTFVPIEGWCNHKYLLHLPGFAYSASLKYKLACGAVVIWYEPSGFRIGANSGSNKWLVTDPVPNASKVQWREFYYPALENYHHAVMIDRVSSDKEGMERILEKIAKVALDADKSRELASNAYHFIDQMFSKQAISCYWLKTLLRYIQLYETL